MMRRLGHWLIQRTSRKRILWAFAVTALVQVVGALTRNDAVIQAIGVMPDLHPGYDATGLETMIAALADNPVGTATVYSLDMLNPTTFGVFLALSFASLVAATGREQTRWVSVISLPMVSAALDIIENLTVVTLVAIRPDAIAVPIVLALSALTLSKFSLMLVMLASLIVLIVDYFRRRRAQP